MFGRTFTTSVVLLIIGLTLQGTVSAQFFKKVKNLADKGKHAFLRLRNLIPLKKGGSSSRNANNAKPRSMVSRMVGIARSVGSKFSAPFLKLFRRPKPTYVPPHIESMRSANSESPFMMMPQYMQGEQYRTLASYS